MEKLRKLFFDEPTHKYTDEFGNTYTSMTTCIKYYVEDFKKLDIAKACERIGKGMTSQGTNHPKYEKYKGKSVKQLLYEWDEIARIACEKGSKKHNYLEDIINNATKFISSNKKYSGNRIYTIQDIIEDHDFGRIDLDYFVASGLNTKYPIIFDIILNLSKQGYKFYAEIATFNPDLLISGLIDLLAVNHSKKEFIIIDWKTNRNKITYASGYFEKDKNGNITNNFIEKFATFAPPIDNVPDSIGHKYSMQVSGYAYLIEYFGFKNIGNIICHIRPSDPNDDDSSEIVDVLAALDLKSEAGLMFNDYSYNNNKSTQKKAFYE